MGCGGFWGQRAPVELAVIGRRQLVPGHCYSCCPAGEKGSHFSLAGRVGFMLYHASLAGTWLGRPPHLPWLAGLAISTWLAPGQQGGPHFPLARRAQGWSMFLRSWYRFRADSELVPGLVPGTFRCRVWHRFRLVLVSFRTFTCFLRQPWGGSRAECHRLREMLLHLLQVRFLAQPRVQFPVRFQIHLAGPVPVSGAGPVLRGRARCVSLLYNHSL